MCLLDWKKGLQNVMEEYDKVILFLWHMASGPPRLPFLPDEAGTKESLVAVVTPQIYNLTRACTEAMAYVHS